MKSWKIPWNALLVTSIVIVAGVCSQSQQVVCAEEDAEEEGRVVQISPDAEIGVAEGLPEEKVAEAPVFWIGIRGRGVQSPVLRTHLQLAEDMGVVVEGVVEKSPAEKAGLRKHDIILRANGAAVHSMEVLQGQVREHLAKPIELKVIRLGKEEIVVVVPEERPEEFARASVHPWQDAKGRFQGGRGDALRQLMEQLQQNRGLQGGIQMFGPGIFGEANQLGQNALPNGVSFSLTRENGGPAKLTIKRGDETWVVVDDDPGSLAQLPEDLRPFAERMLQRGQANMFRGMQFDLDKGLEELLPGGLGRGVIQAPRQEFSRQEKELSDRLEQMEQDLRKLQERLMKEEPDLGFGR